MRNARSLALALGSDDPPRIIMTAAEISALVERELATFHYEPPSSDSGLLGKPWSVERVMTGVHALRAALVPPRLVVLRRNKFGVNGVEKHEAWLVATAAQGFSVAFDPIAKEFALVEPAGNEEVNDINVRGDLVGTFLAA